VAVRHQLFVRTTYCGAFSVSNLSARRQRSLGRRGAHSLGAPFVEIETGVLSPASGKWHATEWSGSSSRRSGCSVAQMSWARGHLVRNRHPDGGLIGLGGSPLIVPRVLTFAASGSGLGIEPNSAAV
jgi:hypothetical protein